MANSSGYEGCVFVNSSDYIMPAKMTVKEIEDACKDNPGALREAMDIWNKANAPL